MERPSLILELQNLAQAGGTDLAELLRRTKVVAVKLRLPELEAWVEHELNGYPESDEVPQYRTVGTELNMKNPYLGLQPVMWTANGALPEHFSKMAIRYPISQVAHLVNAGVLSAVMI